MIHQNLRVGQVWRSNDPRILRGVRILGFGPFGAHVENIVTRRQTNIRLDQFCTGTRGWSLERMETSRAA
jgi:hypothetical protein